MTAADALAVRLALQRAGYSPIPCEGKRPVLKAWEKHTETNLDEITLWSNVYATAGNTGILTRLTPTIDIDIDIKNPEAAAAIEELARDRFEERGFFLVRIGEAPKRAIVLRTDQPFAKITANLTASDGATEKIELLCDGQQVVCFGIHPGTGRPYSWHGGQPGDIEWEELPYVRREDALAFVEAACAVLITDFDYTRIGDRPRQANPDAEEKASDRTFNPDDHGPVDRDKIKAALAVIDSGSYETWLHVGAALHHELGKSGFALFDEWSARSSKYSADECKAKWSDVGKIIGFTAGTIYYLADQADPGWRGRSDSKPLLARINLARYDSEPVPAREWGVPDRFPRRAVCLLSGEGGRGKSITLLQLAAAHVLVKDWLRSLPEPGPVVLINAEDEEGEIIRRLKPIVEHYGGSFADIGRDLHIFSLAGADPLLALPDRSGRIVATPLYAELMTLVRDVKPVCTIIDNVADVFGANEIERSHVRQFIALMRQCAIAGNGYVVMSSHPSLTGIASKTGLSGSTQWHNGVRARAWLHGGEANNGETPDPDLRVLEFLKSNYSRLAETITLRWQTDCMCRCRGKASSTKPPPMPPPTMCFSVCSIVSRAPARTLATKRPPTIMRRPCLPARPKPKASTSTRLGWKPPCAGCSRPSR